MQAVIRKSERAVAAESRWGYGGIDIALNSNMYCRLMGHDMSRAAELAQLLSEHHLQWQLRYIHHAWAEERGYCAHTLSIVWA